MESVDRDVNGWKSGIRHEGMKYRYTSGYGNESKWTPYDVAGELEVNVLRTTETYILRRDVSPAEVRKGRLGY